MKRHSTFVLPMLLSMALAGPAVGQVSGCEEMTIMTGWGCLDENNGWASVDQISGATYPTQILWSTGEDVQFITGLPNGDHWVMVTDAEGCWVKEEFTVDCAKDCDIALVVEWGCLDEDNGWASLDQILNVVYPIDIVWSTGEDVQFITGLPNGDHWVMVTDAEGCWVKEDFTVDCEKDEEPCQLRTQTMGGWGAPANGNNPGVYRNMHFAAAFPAGLTIGCTNTLTLTSASAVQAFLPSGGQPQMLPAGNMVDPGNYNNTLSGQLVALTLSVGFDMNDPDFGTGGLLADAVINNGMFSGWTVQELLDEANNFIGGCASTYTASQLNNALSMVNENFVDGDTNNGNVDCAPAVEARSLADEGEVIMLRAYPVPANDQLKADLVTEQNGVVQIKIMDLMGRTVLEHGSESFMAGEPRTVIMNTNDLGNGSYLIAVMRDGSILRTEHVIISR